MGFSLQMTPEKELSTKEGELLNSTGRPLLVVIPNVTEHVMSALGLDKLDDKGQPKPRRSEAFLDGAPSKSFTGGALKLMAHLNFKYTKSTGELKVSGTYRWQKEKPPEKKPKAPEKKPKARAAAAAGDGGRADNDGVDADGAEHGDESAADADPDRRS